MTRMLTFLSVAIVLFAVAAGASWYFQDRQHHEDGTKAGEEKGNKHAGAAHGKGNGDAAAAAAAKPLVRSPLSADAERITQMAATLQSQQESLKNREQVVIVREKQMDLIHQEIKSEQKKLEAVRKEVDTELALVSEKLEMLEKRTAEADRDRKNSVAQLQEIQEKTVELNGLESKNLKQVAFIYDKMDPEAASQSIQQMVEKGKLDTAVTILANMRDRAAANLLGEISKQDAGVAAQLFDRMRYLKAPSQK